MNTEGTHIGESAKQGIDWDGIYPLALISPSLWSGA